METQTETQDGINASLIGALKAFQRFGDAQLKELDAFDRHCSAMRDRLRYKQNQELEEFSALRLNIPLWNWLTRELELEATAPKIDESVSVNGNQLGVALRIFHKHKIRSSKLVPYSNEQGRFDAVARLQATSNKQKQRLLDRIDGKRFEP